MTMIRPQGTPQQEFSLVELERARSEELAGRVAEAERARAANAVTGRASVPTRIRRTIAGLLRRR